MEAGAKEMQESQVTRQLNKGLSAIGMVEKLITEADTRLSKILREPEPEEVQPESKESERLVPLAEKLKGMNRNIELCASRLEELIRRIEV